MRPDAYLRLALPGELEVWLEWDRGTEPRSRIRDKLVTQIGPD